jgi:hypothetical protein
MRSLAAALAALVLAPVAASAAPAAPAADCYAVPPAIAAKAAGLVKKGMRVAPYCKTCGTPMPTAKSIYTVVKSEVAQPEGVSATATKNKTVWVTLQGVPQAQGLDLRQFYVETKAKSGVFQNLGTLAGCANKEPASIKVQ